MYIYQCMFFESAHDLYNLVAVSRVFDSMLGLTSPNPICVRARASFSTSLIFTVGYIRQGVDLMILVDVYSLIIRYLS